MSTETTTTTMDVDQIDQKCAHLVTEIQAAQYMAALALCESPSEDSCLWAEYHAARDRYHAAAVALAEGDTSREAYERARTRYYRTAIDLCDQCKGWAALGNDYLRQQYTTVRGIATATKTNVDAGIPQRYLRERLGV